MHPRRLKLYELGTLCGIIIMTHEYNNICHLIIIHFFSLLVFIYTIYNYTYRYIIIYHSLIDLSDSTLTVKLYYLILVYYQYYKL